tara:strand:+ start:318 stop:554 length:237 start_codon:yes stop_codon:yes gene_type:complete
MIESDMIILKKLFILKDYVRKIFNEWDYDIGHGKSHFDPDNTYYIDAMSNKVCELKEKLSFKYRRRDEIALRYLVSKL